MRKAHIRTGQLTRRLEGHGNARCVGENVPDIGMLQGGNGTRPWKKQ